jgi:hypothetical protein
MLSKQHCAVCGDKLAIDTTHYCNGKYYYCRNCVDTYTESPTYTQYQDEIKIVEDTTGINYLCAICSNSTFGLGYKLTIKGGRHSSICCSNCKEKIVSDAISRGIRLV